MRKIFTAFCIFLSTALVTVQSAQAASPDAGVIFDTIGGTTTVDRGGAIHSQARSIYSLGGGMTTFQGKKVSLLAVDPPSFSAGCNGISWHFGGFAFISMDEIRQLVEAVAQASLGIAVDLAMQTLCPQCYAVMSKLRDISNMMRNAAADACKIAQGFGDMLKESGIFSGAQRASSCAQQNASTGKTSSVLDGWAGAACSMLDTAEKTLDTAGAEVAKFLKLGNQGGKTPSREQMEAGNATYKALSALGYEDGFIKDMMLSVLGMTVLHPQSVPDCRSTFKDLYGSAKDLTSTATDLSAAQKVALKAMSDQQSPSQIKAANANLEVTPADATVKPAESTAGGTTKGPTICYAPPILTGFADLGKTLMCGQNIIAERAAFTKSYYGDDAEKFRNSSLGVMCNSYTNNDMKNPMMYTCRDTSGQCIEPKMARLNTLMTSTSKNGYTGLAYMIGAALFDGALAVRNNTVMSPTTYRVLNGSGWPLYRLLNMAAVYPGLAHELLSAYGSAIAAQYAMDTISSLSKLGAQPAVDTKPVVGLKPESVSRIREQIMVLTRGGDEARTQILERLAEKRKLVEMVMQVNKALQAEVIGQGLSGNSSLAVGLKRRLHLPPPPTQK